MALSRRVTRIWTEPGIASPLGAVMSPKSGPAVARQIAIVIFILPKEKDLLLQPIYFK